jgi:hypothetical protein
MRYTVKKIQELTNFDLDKCQDIEANIFVDWSQATNKTIMAAVKEYLSMAELEAKMQELGL